MKDIKAKKLTITQEELNKMFDHYIRLRIQNGNCESGSEGDIWTGGMIQEALEWFAIFGVDISYEAILKYAGDDND